MAGSFSSSRSGAIVRALVGVGSNINRSYPCQFNLDESSKDESRYGTGIQTKKLAMTMMTTNSCRAPWYVIGTLTGGDELEATNDEQRLTKQQRHKAATTAANGIT
jgi:hypothetical protein